MREWTLSRMVWVADRGFTSQKNRRALMQGGERAREQVGTQALPAHHPRRAAARGQAEDQDRGEPGRQVPAALLRPAPVRRRHRPRIKAAPGSRARLARHKQILDLRPVYHRREDRIRAHVLLCWLALLLIRVAETTADDPWTWNRIRAELQRLHAVTYTGHAGTFRQTTEPSKPSGTSSPRSASIRRRRSSKSAPTP